MFGCARRGQLGGDVVLTGCTQYCASLGQPMDYVMNCGEVNAKCTCQDTDRVRLNLTTVKLRELGRGIDKFGAVLLADNSVASRAEHDSGATESYSFCAGGSMLCMHVLAAGAKVAGVTGLLAV
jgi:hypothetical protein